MNSRIPELLSKFHTDILNEWTKEQEGMRGRGPGTAKQGQLQQESSEILKNLQAALQNGNTEVEHGDFAPAKEVLAKLSRDRATHGFSPGDTAMFVLSLKKPILSRLRREISDAKALGEEVERMTEVIDRLAVYTTERFVKSREEVIARQQQDMLELSTPVVTLWKGILALPLIGTLDSSRTQVVMESLLQKIVETSSDVAIIDITGVPTVDTIVAQHLMKTVTAARLMGADCIISGIRPQIAQTIVHLGVNLGDITTKSNLADAFAVALKRRSLAVVKVRSDELKENKKAIEETP